MNGQFIFFLTFAMVAILCAVLVIKLKRIAHRVVAMAFCFFAIAGLFFLLGADFLGIIQIIVYAGAVTILFIFAMMMTDHRSQMSDINPRKLHRAVSSLGIAGLLTFLFYGIWQMDLPAADQPYEGSAENIGIELFGNYVIPFLGMGFLLTAALIGAIVIAREEAK